jgi:hypothetical protein
VDNTYTRQQAMDRLGFKSANAFFQLERKYPEAFVVMKRGPGTDVHSRRNVEYDKATLDGFAERRKNFRQEKP